MNKVALKAPAAPGTRWRYLDEYHHLCEVEVLNRVAVPGVVPGFLQCIEKDTRRPVLVFKSCLLPLPSK